MTRRAGRLAVEQAAKTPFAQASADLRDLADVRISPTHLPAAPVCERVGAEWAQAQHDADVEAFRKGELAALPAEPLPPWRR